MKESDASNRKKHLRDLGLEENATNDQIEERFIELCRQWQQSAFNSPRLKRLAQEKIDSLTKSYRELMGKEEAEVEPEASEDRRQEDQAGESKSSETPTGDSDPEQPSDPRPGDADLAEISRLLEEAIAAREEAVRKLTEFESSSKRYFDLWQHAVEQIQNFQKYVPIVIAVFAVALGWASYDGFKSHADWERLSKDYEELHQKFEEQERRISAEKAKPSQNSLEIGDQRSSYFASRNPDDTYRTGVPMDAYAPGVSPPY